MNKSDAGVEKRKKEKILCLLSVPKQTKFVIIHLELLANLMIREETSTLYSFVRFQRPAALFKYNCVSKDQRKITEAQDPGEGSNQPQYKYYQKQKRARLF